MKHLINSQWSSLSPRWLTSRNVQIAPMYWPFSTWRKILDEKNPRACVMGERRGIKWNRKGRCWKNFRLLAI